MDKNVSLKDRLFNSQKISRIASEIHAVFPNFDHTQFVKETLSRFPELELKQRIQWIAETLTRYLPTDFRDATHILLAALPPECDPSLTDNDFGDFIYAPYSEFVVKHGCTATHLSFSLNALKSITTRFSAEDAVRYFINTFPDETLATLVQWATDSHYHVRRLASEGTRPKLPWSQKIILTPEKALPILDALFSDPTRFVTRSVANHLNDISKINPTLVLDQLTQWQHSQKQHPKEMAFIINHSLRTLIKQGHTQTISFLNFSPTPRVAVTGFRLTSPQIQIGNAATFEFEISAQTDERLIIDYVLYFQNKSGAMTNKKVYKIKQTDIRGGQTISIQKQHPLPANMTTRSLYPGDHRIEILVNGTVMAGGQFVLTT